METRHLPQLAASVDHPETAPAASAELAALATLAAGIAHDVNTLLGVINGHAELAGDGMPAGAPARQHLDQIVRASLRARDLTARLLACAHRQAVEPVVVDAAGLIADTVDMLRASLAPGIALSFHSELEDAAMLTGPGQIEQIVMNLCLNAADAMNGHGRLDIALLATEAPGRCCLTVADNGCGMAPEVQESIFDPFYTTREAGRGLGLSVVRDIVRQLRGEIQVRSKTGAGSRFNIYLPLLAASTHSQEKPTWRTYW
ncbi:MAG: ATP-binding protein [Pseudomonadota bacterium]